MLIQKLTESRFKSTHCTYDRTYFYRIPNYYHKNDIHIGGDTSHPQCVGSTPLVGATTI